MEIKTDKRTEHEGVMERENIQGHTGVAEKEDMRGYTGVTEGEDMREYVNEMSLEFDAVSLNESFARVVVAAFITPLNPTVEELADVKTAVSEAVTNAIIHGYDSRGGKIRMYCMVTGNLLTVRVEDDGVGISDIGQAMMPLFTTRPELERSGMGFAFMEAFMDDLKVESRLGEGTRICMMKKLGDASWTTQKGM